MNKFLKRISAITLGLSMASICGLTIASRKISETKADLSSTGGTYNYSVTENIGTASSIKMGDVTWNYSTDNAGYTSFETNKMHYGSGSKSISYIQFETGDFADYKVTSVSVTGYDASGDTKLDVSVDGVALGTQQSFSKTSSTVTCSDTKGLSGDSLVVKVSRSATAKKAIYFAGISVKYEPAVDDKTLESISVKTSPSKVAYLSGESFDPTGLVITAMYDDKTSTDIAYSGNESKFSFNKTLITESGNVVITYGDKTCNQAVTVVSLSSVTVSGTLQTQFVGKAWNSAGLIVTAHYSNGGTEDVTAEASLAYSPETITSTSLTSVSIVATFNSVSSEATPFAVKVEEAPLATTYDFTKNFGTYAKDWGGYAQHIVTGTDVGADYEAKITMENVSKQSGTITDRPVFAAKSGTTASLTFVLDSSVSKEYAISSVHVEFRQWTTSKKVDAAIYKGVSVSGDKLDSFANTTTASDLVLDVDNLNGDSFIINFTTSQTSNQQIGLSSIDIGLFKKASFGTLDHIKVTSMPASTYHVGEEFDSTGLAVTAYDGSNESTANYKDVTASVDMSVAEDHIFSDSEIPGIDVEVTYEENSKNVQTSFHVDVYAVAEYKLVESAPTDWSGNYLIVAKYTDEGSASHTVALNSALVNFDQPLNFKEVEDVGGVISAGQECEFKFASYSTGYSAQGKNGKYIFGNSSNRLMTSESQQVLTISLNETVATITGASGFNLRFNSSNAGAERFGFYNSGTVNVSLYKLVESNAASDYADLFLETVVCDGQGNITSNDWDALATSFSDLSGADKAQFIEGTASETGSNIQQCLARYDYIVGKYGSTTYADFMSRNPTFAARQVQIYSSADNNTAITVVIIVSLVSVTSLGVLIILKKRKTISK